MGADASGAAATALSDAKAYTDEQVAGLNLGESNVQPDWNETDSTSDAYIKNKPESLPASDVSAWAKAKTKPSYTAAEVGAVAKLEGKNLSTNDYTDAEKDKLNNTNVAYGTCSTAAATAAKEVIILDNENWQLKEGSIITVKFTYTNTAQKPTLNVNGTGAKSILYNTAVVTTSTLSFGGYAGRYIRYMYDGTQYVFIGWSIDSNSTYTPASLGGGYGTCSTAAATAAKTAILSGYSLVTGGTVSVKFTYAVPASATLNINGKGAKPIYYRGSAIAANIIQAGDTATFVYNGSQYHLLTVDRDESDSSKGVPLIEITSCVFSSTNSALLLGATATEITEISDGLTIRLVNKKFNLDVYDPANHLIYLELTLGNGGKVSTSIAMGDFRRGHGRGIYAGEIITLTYVTDVVSSFNGGTYNTWIAAIPPRIDRATYIVDGTDAAASMSFYRGYVEDKGIILLSVTQEKTIGSVTKPVALATYAYSYLYGDHISNNTFCDTAKVAALTGSMSNTYGSITATSGTDTTRALITIKATKGYIITVDFIA